MNEEFARKLVELAEGFNQPVIKEQIVYSNCIISHAINTNDTNIREWIFYPLLLYRAVEGWNKNKIKERSLNTIIIFPEEVSVFTDKLISKLYSRYKDTEYLTAKEQAIEELLMEVLK